MKCALRRARKTANRREMLPTRLDSLLRSCSRKEEVTVWGKRGTGSLEKKICGLCERLVEGAMLQRHHLIPRSEGGKHQIIKVHILCHRIIHSLFTNKELSLLSLSDIRNHESVKICIEWMKPFNAEKLNRQNIGRGSLPKAAVKLIEEKTI